MSVMLKEEGPDHMAIFWKSKDSYLRYISCDKNIVMSLGYSTDVIALDYATIGTEVATSSRPQESLC